MAIGKKAAVAVTRLLFIALALVVCGWEISLLVDPSDHPARWLVVALTGGALLVGVEGTMAWFEHRIAKWHIANAVLLRAWWLAAAGGLLVAANIALHWLLALIQ